MRLWSFFVVLMIPNLGICATTVSGFVGLSDNPLDRSESTVSCIQCGTNTCTVNPEKTLTDGSYTLSNVPVGVCIFSASHDGYLQENQTMTIVMDTDNKLNFILSKGNVQLQQTYSIDGTITLDSSGGNTPASLSGSRFNVWTTDGSQHFSAVTDVAGHFVIDKVPKGSYQAGAAREGYLTQVLDPLELTANRTLDFQLAVDPTWDYGPGIHAHLPGCSVGPTNNPLWIIIAGFLIWWVKKYTHT